MKHYLLEAKISESEFKKDWSMVEYEGVCAIVQRWYEENLPMQARKETAEYFFGLPYTSTSSFAMISNTNTYCEITPGYNIVYFALTENHRVIVGAWNDEEEEIQFVIN